MTVTIPVDHRAVDLAWTQYHWGRYDSHEARAEASMSARLAMLLAGVSWADSLVLLQGRTLPSTSGQLAGVL